MGKKILYFHNWNIAQPLSLSREKKTTRNKLGSLRGKKTIFIVKLPLAYHRLHGTNATDTKICLWSFFFFIQSDILK